MLVFFFVLNLNITELLFRWDKRKQEAVKPSYRAWSIRSVQAFFLWWKVSSQHPFPTLMDAVLNFFFLDADLTDKGSIPVYGENWKQNNLSPQCSLTRQAALVLFSLPSCYPASDFWLAFSSFKSCLKLTVTNLFFCPFFIFLPRSR